MATLRSKPLRSGAFSLYIDYNKKTPYFNKQGELKHKRKLEYLNLKIIPEHVKKSK